MILIEELNLTVKTYNCCKRNGVNTIEDLRIKTEIELLAYKNFSQNNLREVKEILGKYGLSLKE
jgi:DNA-directed RNA polymerase subunit alpha